MTARHVEIGSNPFSMAKKFVVLVEEALAVRLHVLSISGNYLGNDLFVIVFLLKILLQHQ